MALGVACSSRLDMGYGRPDLVRPNRPLSALLGGWRRSLRGLRTSSQPPDKLGRDSADAERTGHRGIAGRSPSSSNRVVDRLAGARLGAGDLVGHLYHSGAPTRTTVPWL